ncbi:MAG: hypothetical protein ORO03_09930 [Alphaproteobacteria bacterium]|nr:hypothetical protein [Alphaproteobacteria bacterium]
MVETFFGKVCLLHPNAKGKRDSDSNHCVECINERKAHKVKLDAEFAERAAQRAAIKAERDAVKAQREADKTKRKQQQAELIARGLPLPPVTYFGRICIAHPEFNGERREQNCVCVECHRENQRLDPKVRERKRKYMEKRRQSPEFRIMVAEKRRQRAEEKRLVERFDKMVDNGQVDFAKSLSD